jgi:inactivated superfamily I helicase
VGYNRPPHQLYIIDRRKSKGSTKKTRSLREEIEEVIEEFSKEELVEAHEEHAQLAEEYKTEDWDKLEELENDKEAKIHNLKLEVEHLKR